MDTVVRRRWAVAALTILTAAAGLAAAQPAADAATYSPGTTTFVAINDGANGETGTDPYPASVTAEGMGGAITDVDVEIPDLYHARPGDLKIVLVAPSGTSVILKTYLQCEGDLDYQRPHVGWRFSDQAGSDLADEACPSGWWRPSVTAYDAQFSLPAPAPPGPYATKLSALNGQNPNGTWRLFVNDPYGGAQGELDQGFRVHITTGYASAIIGDADGGGPASTYPLPQTIFTAGKVADVKVALSGITHRNPADLDVVLVGPTGRSVVLMSDACGGADLNGTVLIFSSLVPSPLSFPGPCGSGTYQPTDYPATENLPAPAPPGPYATSLGAFTGTRAKGTWNLYISDDLNRDSGYLTSWVLAVQTYPQTTITEHPPATTTSHRARFAFTADRAAATFECRLDSAPWEPCTSPKEYAGLALRTHTFRVRAVSQAGYRDRSPAKWEWRVTASRDQRASG